MTSISPKVEILSDLSVHGLNQIGKIHGSTKRKALFWAVIFALTMVLLGLQISRLSAYMKTYPTLVSIKSSTGPIEFPTVTFCSLGMVKKSIARKVPVFQQMQTVMDRVGKTAKRKKRQSENSTVSSPVNDANTTVLQSNTISVDQIQAILQPIPIQTSVESCQNVEETVRPTESKETTSAVVETTAVSVKRMDPSLPTTELAIQPNYPASRKREKRSVVHIDCNGYTCPNSPIVNFTSSKPNINSCFLSCAFWPIFAYAFDYDSVSLDCICYNADCCATGYQVAAPNAIGCVIAQCDDVFAGTSGWAKYFPPYPECILMDYTCYAGATTAENKTFVKYNCGKAGLWEPTFSPCIGYCPNIFTFTTGSVSPSGPYAPGSYNYTCNAGYLTPWNTMSKTYTCFYSLGWSYSPAPPCIAQCQLIPRPQAVMVIIYGSLINYLVPSGVSAYFACWPNYTIEGNSLTANCNNGSWDPISSKFPQCFEECQLIMRPQTAMSISYSGPLVQNLIPSGLYANFTCATNYTFVGNYSKSKCFNGSWDLSASQFPQCFGPCSAIDPLTLFPRLQVTYNKTNPISHGSIAKFFCNESYIMYGDFNETSCFNGTWDVALVDYPICLADKIAFYDANTLSNYGGPSVKTDNFAAGSALLDMMTYIMSNLSDSTKTTMGFSREDNLISCTYDHLICERSEIIGFNDNSVGNCYSFNHKYLNESIIAERPGDENGLYWILNTKQEEFLSIIATSGIKLVVHQRFEPIFPNVMGITVSAGFTYAIGLRKEREIKVETPNQLCYDDPSRAKFYYLNNCTYAIEACARSLYQSQVTTNCTCASPNLPFINDRSISSPCGLENRTCVNNVLEQNSTGSTADFCPQSCTFVSEKMTVTVTAEAHNSQLFTRFNFSKQYATSNLVSVKVFYESLEAIDYVEEVSYTIFNLITDVGSSMGLLVGMSAVSVVELVVTIGQMLMAVKIGK